MLNGIRFNELKMRDGMKVKIVTADCGLEDELVKLSQGSFKSASLASGVREFRVMCLVRCGLFSISGLLDGQLPTLPSYDNQIGCGTWPALLWGPNWLRTLSWVERSLPAGRSAGERLGSGAHLLCADRGKMGLSGAAVLVGEAARRNGRFG